MLSLTPAALKDAVIEPKLPSDSTVSENVVFKPKLPSDSTVWEDAVVEPRGGLLQLSHWQPEKISVASVGDL
jgi:hypothetical protein